MKDEKVTLTDEKKKAKERRLQELEDVKFILGTPQGVRFFRRLLESGRVFQTTFTGNSQTFFLEGHRNLALEFLADVVEATPDKITELMQPAKK